MRANENADCHLSSYLRFERLKSHSYKKMAELKLVGTKRNLKRGRANIASIDRSVGHPFDLRKAPNGVGRSEAEILRVYLYIFCER